MSEQQDKAAPPVVGIVMGSDSDWAVMQKAVSVLKQFNIAFEATVSSAHRSPERTAEYARSARARGLKVIIVGAGAAAHLAGAVAALTTLPVIGVPIDSSALKGLDALLSTVQMPSGIPVATMAIGSAGAKNAAILAAQILAASESGIADKLEKFKKKLAAQVAKKDQALQGAL
ncbi:MAG: 5-(carboxyamino)imidazole ribonucleotide mutase [Deltaproteobacteria bacterium]|nr:5-(carboxyamino)imidazole ribonucleotide mutase [Deltaproteobacteria bacterium]